MTDVEPSARVARVLVAALVAHGVRDVVLAPGSRSAPLAYALLAAADAGWLRLHVRVDERSAGFLALGLTRTPGDAGAEEQRPVAVVTTSGTAVANLHPAVLEAAHAGRPLVVVSADRPHELRGTGANQTTEQVGIFGRAVRATLEVPARQAPAPGDGEGWAQADDCALEAHVARVLAAACGLRTRDPGPVHLNVAFREPLVASSRWAPGEPPTARPAVAPAALGDVHVLGAGPRTVVVAGDGAGPAARDLAEDAGWPLLAEPTSGSRGGALAVGPYRLLLDVPGLGDAVERVVVLGHPTLSRPVARLLARPGVEVVVVAPTGATWTDVAGTAARVVGAVDVGPGAWQQAAGWRRRWRAAAEAGARVVEAAVRSAPELEGLAVARAVATATQEGAGGARTLVAGASLAIRDLDVAAVPPLEPRGRLLANRGLAGIDGTVSTAAGVALAAGEPVRALVGDLTFQHDVGGLACGPTEAEPDLQVVVVNDDGGAIFATLEHGEPARAGDAERLFGTPQGLDVAALAAGFGVRCVTVDGAAGLREALAEPVRGRSVVEVRTDRAGLRERRSELARAVRAAAADAVATHLTPASPHS